MQSIILARAITLMQMALSRSVPEAERLERCQEIFDMLNPIIGD